MAISCTLSGPDGFAAFLYFLDRSRRFILFSVWAVVIFGLPLWWKTTRVYRAELPFEDIEKWNEWKVTKIFDTIKQLVNGAGSQGADKVKDQLKAVKYAPGYQITFSLFSGDASNGVREWKMQEAINAYLAPFLKSMSAVSKFTVESQVQHYASLTFKPELDTSRNEHYLAPDSLPNFINAAEWSLASTVSSLPSLNFLTYVPKPSESPLVIKSGPSAPRSSTNSFLIPRWGGITILNRDNSTSISPHVITVQELGPVMKVFLMQLRDLMGLADLSAARASFPITFHKTSNEAPTAWELDNLLRRRSAENLMDSLATLTSLARLVVDTPNMVVLDHIQKDVVDALEDISRSCQRLSEQAYVEALAASRDALVKSETAFFDPTMVSMLYFPDEHKYAIYMPLFVPISVPLVMALLRELKKWKDAKKATSKQKTD
ncbi:phosphatidylinositol-glycan biosynthesis class S protein [Gamsiella multidivaricata]|uniref:phosphatidylinositol-glycan biosynthesis class S protein n=1 Tax=Gamsiella multidivaricata TaxID=101098 RepID=UPI00221FA9C2|nr:phosphatidylinositol-glycan biosynthesis class S protein [Gamsiella multidivaricata]KAI7831453.1 phosphatidylinositol-glycan biosynthesis class S protein [Gamsiella multidivaricata]